MAQLVALQGGTVDIEACPGEGTAVLVRLPEPMGSKCACPTWRRRIRKPGASLRYRARGRRWRRFLGISESVGLETAVALNL